ncbi:MAG: phosphoglycerate kinase [Runella slithyformis]|nr:MAG: phosphoglycerate kinase [Runella slithyformis]TAE94255.1 MAG: phosphoglycerate kinase [Runella slithyformis]TAF29370.1 MAG: phosphoglycerate kinase [Runella slithyformis]TAF48388.1 MAG: phosphoglycerate kinase [Runella slithyformis]TAF83266.1 MAG: phosphoglycerate kinase [Runella slithyformis]
MKTLDSYSFAGKRALVRVDFNVPLNDKFEITDDTRMQATLPTIRKILTDGGSCVLMSHLGRPKDGPTEKYSLKHLVGPLSLMLGVPVQFADDCIGQSAIDLAANLPEGGVLLLENLRFYKQEEKGDAEFAQKLSKLGDVWVNDAFGTAHRAHASTAVIGQFFERAANRDRICGYVMQAEIDNAQRLMDNAERPFTAIMGGAKISDKILIIERLLDKVDNLIIGGGMTYTFTKALGGQIGKSLLEADKQELALELLEKAKAKGVNIIMPSDNVCADAFSNDANRQIVATGHIADDWQGLDIGPETVKTFSEIIAQSKTVLWNGPMGVFEFPNFATGTNAIAAAVVKATEENGAFSLIGGGDSASAVNNAGYGDRVSYVSTGGGALLEYMEGKILPGVAALA